MWANFDGRRYTREGFTTHVADLTFTSWRPKFIVLHNTSSPTLAQWMAYPEDQRIRNLQAYYDTNLHWHAGPHLFISNDAIFGFTDLTAPGVHASCFNSDSIGIEMAGEYNVESFTTGPGADVRDNAV